MFYLLFFGEATHHIDNINELIIHGPVPLKSPTKHRGARIRIATNNIIQGVFSDAAAIAQLDLIKGSIIIYVTSINATTIAQFDQRKSRMDSKVV